MVDTIHLFLGHDTESVNDYEGALDSCTDVTEIRYPDGGVVCSGRLGCMNVRVAPRHWLKVCGSLSRFHTGSNIETLSREGCKSALVELSDVVGLDMQGAQVRRLDIAENYIVQERPSAYFGSLGALARFERTERKGTLLYRRGKTMECTLYDKIAESQATGLTLPELYQNVNVLRYELRYLKVGRILGKHTASEVLERSFFTGLVERYKNTYLAIVKDKVKSMKGKVNGKKSLTELALARLVNELGGIEKTMQGIKEGNPELTRKQLYDIRKMLYGLPVDYDGATIVDELTRKVLESVTLK